MKEILIFAGTTEGRKLSERLAASGIVHTVCVATEYGEIVLKEHPAVTVRRGRMNREEIREFLQKGGFGAVVDATHPYAELVTANLRAAMEGMGIPYLRLKRETEDSRQGKTAVHFETNEACARALEDVKGNILLTTGSKELAKYCVSEQVRSRLFVRVLPGMESLSRCLEQGIRGKQIIAMQGPFTVEMNEATIRQYGISCLVTKQSGICGGYAEKQEAAEKAGIPLFVIGHPQEEEGHSFSEICEELERLCGQNIRRRKGSLEIILAGIGMGDQNNLTKEVQDAIREADILLGSERVLRQDAPGAEKRPFYLADQILPYLREVQENNLFSECKKAVVLFSGDSGFYSGCNALYHALQEEIREGRLNAGLRILPGISSAAYLAACIGETYQDAAVYSMHGKEVCNLARRIQTAEKTFLLMSGVRDVNRLGESLLRAGMSECEIVTGYQLSYPEQRIRKMTPGECAKLTEEGLYTCFVKNPASVHQNLAPGISDGEFIRGQVPMTKEEIREISLCKLKLHPHAILYDIGSGTGSVAVEAAGLSDEIRVYAVEQKKEALSLIRQNQERFLLENIILTEAKAPEGLEELPKATHAFIGGSGGRLKEILGTLYGINPAMRVVIHAVSVETICEIRESLALYPTQNEELVQVQVSRAQKAGHYHLMRAENPVWICAFEFLKASEVSAQKMDAGELPEVFFQKEGERFFQKEGECLFRKEGGRI